MKIGNIEVYGVIYKITNKVNGKVYIGQTTRGFKKRYGGNLLSTTNNHLKRAIYKYGLESFTIIEVYDIAFSKTELNIKEMIYICLYGSYKYQYGYNKTYGGEGGTHTEETRKKLSKSLKGRKLSKEHIQNMSRSMKGKKHTDETRKKLSEVKKGKELSLEHKKKISEAVKKAMNRPEIKEKISEAMKGKMTSIEHRKKISEARKGKLKGADSPVARAVICLNTGTKFDTTTEASKWAGLKSYVSITQACKGKCKTAGKHPVTGERLRWAYYDEYLKQQGA